MKKSSKQFRSEWASLLKNKKILIPVIAVLFIPVLYSGMFLWAFWDPYENLDQIPVAVVNSDNGADFEGEHLEIGNELVDKLKDEPEFKWDFVDEEEANKGLEDQTYYMKIHIPEDFSKKSTTVLDEHPDKLNLEYVPNESFNFLAGQIGGTAVSEIKSQIAENITENYSELVFDKFSEIADGLSDASEGAGELADGSSELKDGTKQLKDNLAVLNEGSIELTNGLSSAENGSIDLANGISEANQGTTDLLDGLKEKQPQVSQLADGSSQLSNGLGELSSNMGEFKGGQEQLLAGVKQSRDGTKQLMDGLNASVSALENKSLPSVDAEGLKQSLTTGVTNASAVPKELQGVIESIQGSDQYTDEQKQALISQLQPIAEKSGTAAKSVGEAAKSFSNEAEKLSGASSSLDALVEGQRQLAQGATALYEGQGDLEQGLEKFGDKINQANAGIEQLHNGAIQVADGTNTVSAGWSSLIDNVGTLNSGMTELSSGSQELASGLSELEGGSSEITSGAGKLADGSKDLDNGAQKLTDGTSELRDKLGDAAEETSNTNADDETYSMFADPVNVDTEAVSGVPNYGTGFAPYFLSLGLFVGALLMSIVFPLRDPAVTPRTAIGWFMSKYGILLVVGVIQALVSDAVLLYALQIEVQSVPLFLLFSVVSSLAYMTLIQFFVTTLGDPGRFVAIIILILQLTTSAGTFPLELIPEGLQVFNTWLPMTYTVSGLKAVISSGDFAFMWQNVYVLLGFIAIFAIGTITFFFVELKKRKKHGLEPAMNE
ncbi:YhgE/Pip domain-containing protein [Pseudalkalibacillus hwajinpoensis]|uniref:YhgE/Pip domain-containing protein n=1 Tax=Guptibacillus hwajinpoensis TaxID=208199 RepID=UPI001CD78E4C|nr:YhgE/Pip domain-containing protein [Pseudalkalibacillus hwajinpoensis]MCA0993064.1 YhgE/Pip domain-containing protein [Pseudalkalibacillus hwajinpoensis]